MPGDVNGLVRFRADPQKIRVSVRRSRGGGWVAFVIPRGEPGPYHRARHRYAYRAVILALTAAERAGVDGVDLSMSWAFLHPWSTPEQRGAYAEAVS